MIELERPGVLRGVARARGVIAACVVAGCAGVAGCGSSTSGSTPAPAPVVSPPRATGEILAWDTLAAMPTPRANHCSVVANGFLVVIGGNYKPKGSADFLTIADVHVARIGADGSVGDWKLAGQTPSPVSSCTAASDGKNIVLVDGIYDDTTAGSKVRRASLSDAGDLGAWQELGPLPDGTRVLYSSAAIVGGALRAFDARLPDNGDGISLVGAPIADAALGAWQQKTWLTGFRGHPQYAFAALEGGGAYVYTFGGYSSSTSNNAVLADGAGAPLDAAGVPGASFTVPELPKPTSFGQAIAIDDFVFVIGGKNDVFAGTGRGDAFSAKIGAGGALDPWATVASLPQGRTSHALAASGDFVYVTGGGFDAGGLDTVFAARVRFAPAAARP